jgi:multiple sugar transport system substrate-binding protein
MSQAQSGLRRLVAFKRALLPALAISALAWSGAAGAQSAAQRAVDAAKKICAGNTITIVWEAGLQSLDPLNFSGPKWEQLTGCKVKVVEVPVAEMFTKIMQEYRAGTGAYDALNVIPAWMPDLAQAGALRCSTRTSTSTASAPSCRRSRRLTATTR